MDANDVGYRPVTRPFLELTPAEFKAKLQQLLKKEEDEEEPYIGVIVRKDGDLEVFNTFNFTKEEIDNAIDSICAESQQEPDYDLEIYEAIDAAQNIQELKAALLGKNKKGRVPGKKS